MPVRLYALLTWTTHRRLPLLHPEVARFLRRFLPIVATRKGARLVATGIGAITYTSCSSCPPSMTYRGSSRR